MAVNALLPKLLELHGGMSSRWAREHVKTFVSMGGPYLGTSRAARLSVAGNGMVMESFFSNREAAAIVRSLSSVPSLFQVPYADRAILAVAAVAASVQGPDATGRFRHSSCFALQAWDCRSSNNWPR